MVQLPQRVGVAILKNKKMLIVSGKGKEMYWTLGGKLDPEETIENALRRELKEELDVDVKSFELIGSQYMTDISGSKKEFIYYLVDITGKVKPSSEIDKIRWLSKTEFHERKINISEGVIKCMEFLIKMKLV